MEARVQLTLRFCRHGRHAPPLALKQTGPCKADLATHRSPGELACRAAREGRPHTVSCLPEKMTYRHISTSVLNWPITTAALPPMRPKPQVTCTARAAHMHARSLGVHRQAPRPSSQPHTQPHHRRPVHQLRQPWTLHISQEALVHLWHMHMLHRWQLLCWRVHCSQAGDWS